MSGTSLDGLDLALVELQKDGKYFNLLASQTIKYPKKWELALKAARELSGNALTKLNVNYGEYLGQTVKTFLIGKQKPDLIASHGHTVFHQPQLGYTLQIGSVNEITLNSGITTVGDFRSLDVSKGGQGAPLVPIGDEMLFSDYDYCINLGGISNYSCTINGKRIAKDLSPCNIVSNLLSNQLGYEYDNNGELGRKGELNKDLLSELNNWAYYTNGQSLGIEDLEKDFIPMIDNSTLSIHDKLRTYYEHIGFIIGSALKSKNSKALVSGGGAKNQMLVDCIQKYSQAEIIIPSDEIIDFKEAIIFALLGFLRINNRTNILSSVTGASSDSSSGIIVHP